MDDKPLLFLSSKRKEKEKRRRRGVKEGEEEGEGEKIRRREGDNSGGNQIAPASSICKLQLNNQLPRPEPPKTKQKPGGWWVVIKPAVAGVK